MRYYIVCIFICFRFILSAQTWQSIGPESGYFKDFVFHPSNPQIIFAGSDDSGGIWKSIDGGTTWSLTTSSFPNFTGWKIVIDTIDQNTIYACELYGRYGVLKSINGGSNWTLINNGLSSFYDRQVTGLVIAYNTPDTLLISTGYDGAGTPPRPGNGVFRSYNGGNTWSFAGLQGLTVPCIASNGPGGAIFAGTKGQGLMITTDLGNSWINHPQIPNNVDILEIESDSNIVILSAGGAGIYLSVDHGNNFSNIGMVAEANFDINIYKKNPTIELFSSTFSGLKKYSSVTSSWTPVNNTELNNHMAIGIASKNNTILVSNFNNGPIIRSTDGGTNWNAISASPKASEIGGLYVDPSNPNHILTSLLGTYNIGNLQGKEAIMESTNGGSTWVRKGPVAHGRGITKANSTPGSFYLGSFGKGLFKTTDAFATYTNVITGNKTILDVAVNPFNSQEIIVSQLDNGSSTYSILKSTDAGITFSVTSSLVCTKLEYDPVIANKVYASTFAGLFESTDGGDTWNNLLFIGIPQTCVKSTQNHLYLARIDGILYRIVGTNTINITGPWPINSHISNIIEYNGRLVIGINGAEKDTINNLFGSTYLSNDSGTTWVNITGNMPCTHIYGMNALQGVGNDLYIGTYGGGVYKLQGIVTSVSEKRKTSTEALIFPNPASDKIQFSKEIHVTIYDVSGKIKFSGITKELNTSEWANGVYFMRNERSTFKFIVSH